MAINLTPGEIYFIREKEVLTGEVSNYVKVGLVREGEDRNSEDRASEHQTGNPRLLSVYEVIKTDAVSSIENILHGIYANYRISGEWFKFDDTTLKSCIAKAKTLAAEAKANIGFFSKAKEFKEKVSAAESKLPTAEILAWHQKYLRAEVVFKECARLSSAIKEIFIEALDQDEEVDHIIVKQEKKVKLIFDKEKFENSYPDLYAKYQILKETVSGSFRWVSPKEFDTSLEVINPELAKFGISLEDMITSVLGGKTSKETLHTQNLRLLGFIALAKWDMDIAQANVQTYCADSASVENICKWVREMKSKSIFDEKLLREELPELYAEFTHEEAGGVAHIVNPKQGYANEESKID